MIALPLEQGDLDRIISEAGVGPRTAKKLREARANLAGEAPASGSARSSRRSVGHGAPGPDESAVSAF